jgi:hypothetical protein
MTLERTYRWVLACYPWEHRQQYGDEMLGVLLDDAGARRRRTPVRDLLDLLSGALRVRFRYAANRLFDQRWRGAAAAVGLFAALALLAHTGRMPLSDLTDLAHNATTAGAHPALRSYFHYSTSNYWWPALGWTAVVVSASVGWRRTAAVLAWAAAVAQAIWMADDSLVNVWPLVLAVLAATALTVAPPRPGMPVFGRRPLTLLVTGALLCTTTSAIGGAVGPWGWLHVKWAHVGNLEADWIFPDNTPYFQALLLSAGYVLIALAVLATPPILRRRILTLLVPVAATLLFTQLEFRDWSFLAWPFKEQAGRSLTHWLALVPTPLVALMVAVAVVHRRERPPRSLALRRPGEEI